MIMNHNHKLTIFSSLVTSPPIPQKPISKEINPISSNARRNWDCNEGAGMKKTKNIPLTLSKAQIFKPTRSNY